MAAAALTESAAAFEKQAAALGLDAEWLAGLKAQQITTFGRLAFSCGQPGTAVADADVRTLLQNAAPAKAITVGDMAIMKRLIFEAQTAELKLDSTGHGITVKDSQSEQVCAVSTELDVMEAMTRRSLAFDAAGLIAYETFQKWVNYMFGLMRQAPPPGFKAPNITQLLRADRQAFVRMQELTRDGIKPKPDGTRPLDKIVDDLHMDHTVVYFMMPVQEKPPPAKPAKSQPKDDSWKWNQKSSQSSWKSPKQDQWKKGGQAKGGGGTTGKLPLALKGCASSTPDGKRICFAYNIDGCPDGDNCSKGAHVCCTKGCFDKHPHYSCPKK
eukprot:Skav213399  [mRNA]  locus=scaffold797:570558:571853:- [translate_table: standard]